jgi:hypothetical protein
MEGELSHSHPSRSYRCHYTPLDRDGFPVASDSGLLPFVQVKADNAEHAVHAAFATIRCPISHVERLDDEAATLGWRS